MAAPIGTVWGSIVGNYGQIGIYTSISNASSGKESTLTVQVWFKSKYSVSDTGNTLYYDNLEDTGSATTSKGAVSINTSVASGEGWSPSNEVKIATFTHTNTRGTSARTRYLYAKLTGVDRVGGTMTVSTTEDIPKLASYTVKYNANGGSGAPSSQTKWHGKTLVLSSSKPTRTGYTFKGWGTSTTDTTVNYAAGASYTTDESITLYAIWTANTYTVKYDANGGSGAPSNQTKTHGTSLTLSNTKPTRTNYTFKGWGTSAGSTTVAYSAGGSYAKDANITLYAIWSLAYAKPKITNLSVVRCDSSGTPTEDGTNALVTFDWECEKTLSGITIEWKTAGTTNTNNVYTSGTSGTVSKVVGSNTISVDSVYTFVVTVTDSGGSGSASRTLNSQMFPIDVWENKAIAFGKSAEIENTFECNYESKFYQPMYLTGAIYSQRGACFGGKLSSEDGVVGSMITKDGYIVLQGATQPYIAFYVGANTSRTARIYATSSGTLFLENSAGQVQFTSEQLRPSANDTFYLGGSSYKWKDIYSMKAANNTSDRNLKENIIGIGQKYEELFSRLKPVTYEFKGEGHDRIHIGFIAQDVKEAMDEVKLSDMDFAAYCMDIKKKYDAEKDEDVVVLDENGKPVETYALRYAEFIALNTHMIQKQQKEIDDLKIEIEKLKALIKGTS